MPTENIVILEKIVPSGKSLAHIDGKAVFVWGGLPGEKVKIEIYKNKKSYSEARLIEVIKPSKDRTEACEGHHLICSPWQVMSYQKQIEVKKELLKQSFFEATNTIVPISSFNESAVLLGYRTKLEFSFTEDSNKKIRLAFHKRGVNNEYEIIDGCKLGSAKMNQAADKITEILNNSEGIKAKGLKSLVIRESKLNQKIIAVLFYKFKEFEFDIKLSNLDGLVDGIFIAYSTIKSPISVVSEMKYSEGIDFLEEKILNKIIRYPFDGFFQNNLPMFEKALTDIRSHIKECEKIVEIYSGTGSIGLNIADKTKELTGIEIVPSAIRFAGINKSINNITNYNEIELSDNKITKENLLGADVLILDPPRSGLHPKTLKRIIEAKPKKIIYLSCNPVTQARDYKELSDTYSIINLTGYDFYPNTFHMESLLVLELSK